MKKAFVHVYVFMPSFLQLYFSVIKCVRIYCREIILSSTNRDKSGIFVQKMYMQTEFSIWFAGHCFIVYFLYTSYQFLKILSYLNIYACIVIETSSSFFWIMFPKLRDIFLNTLSYISLKSTVTIFNTVLCCISHFSCLLTK